MTTHESKIAALKAELETVIDLWTDIEDWDGSEDDFDETQPQYKEEELEDEEKPKENIKQDGPAAQDDQDDNWVDEDDDKEDEDEDEDMSDRQLDDRKERRRKILIHRLLGVQSALCQFVREIEVEHPSDLPLVLEAVDEILNHASLWANENNTDRRPFEEGHMGSYAQDGDNSPLIKDASETESRMPNRGLLAKMLPFFRELYHKFPDGSRDPDELVHEFTGPRPWKKTIRLHPSSTLCARFKEPVPEFEQTDDNEDATALFQARCEVISGSISEPWDLSLSRDGSILTYCAAGGYKDRTPYFRYFLPAEGRPPSYDFLESRSFRLDLLDRARATWIDEERNLIFVGDWTRLKSYRYRSANAPKGTKKGLAVHTMNSGDYSGPMAVLGDGRVLRAGKGSVAVWQLDDLPTHGEDGKSIIGQRIAVEDMETWMDDPENIEPSTGSEMSTTIQLEGYNSSTKKNEGTEIHRWHKHPSQEGILLCGMDDEASNNFCHAYDFNQAGGKIAARYLGHGGGVEEISTVAGEPNLFLTRCTDGHARLYDTRHPLPVATVAGMNTLEPMTGAALATPNGHPFIFTATAHAEDIKVWDVRSRSIIYELATGNNMVEGLAWDQHTNSLYAATSNPHQEPDNRYFPTYRPARLPKHHPEGDDGLGEDDEDEDEEHPTRRWPTGAFHSENYFGHIFDCRGGHRMFKYTFKPDADATVLPFW